MKPSNFTRIPMNSVLGKYEPELIAANIMVILKRTGDQWRDLSWDVYKTERLKDGNFSNGEKFYFDQVIPYCQSADMALAFCKDW